MAEEEGSAQHKEVVHVCWDVHSLGDCPVTKKLNSIESQLGGERAHNGRQVQFEIFRNLLL